MRVFLGYPSERLTDAEEVYAFLKGLDLEVWFDKVSLVGGDDWDRERAVGQKSADFVVHLISSDMLQRPGVVHREIRQTLALLQDQPHGASYVTFLRLDDVRMPAELLHVQYIDYFKGQWRDQLATTIEKRRNQLGGRVPQHIIGSSTQLIAAPETADAALRAASQIESNISTELYVASSTHLQYPETSPDWRYINARLASDTLDGLLSAVTEFRKMDADDEDRVQRYGAPYEWSLTMQEFFRRDDLLSIRVSTFWYSGGAHPNYGITSRNFLGPFHHACSIETLLGHDGSNAARLAEYCRKVLTAQLDDDTGMIDYANEVFAREENHWSLLSQFNFDARGLTINFSPYDVLPFAFGSHEVFVPWRFISPMLSESVSHIPDALEGRSSSNPEPSSP